MDRMLSTVAKLAQQGARNDDDIVDRLHHRFTVLFLVIFTVVISSNQYIGAPIHCWSPAYFEESHEKYADRVCWISDTYYLPEDSPVLGHPKVVKKHINYYQWVPVVLLAQALMFRLPCIFWRIFSDRSGINVNNLVEAAETIQNALYPERREKTIRYMIRHLDHYLDYQRDYRGGACDAMQQCLAHGRPRLIRRFVCGNRRGNYLIILYTTTKLLYLANVVGQFYLLDHFLGGGYHLYGVRVIADLILGQRHRYFVTGSEVIFPLVTLCDFQISQVGNNVHKHTVQCVLPINFFSEKIYLVLWFWLALLGIVTASSLLRWAWVLLPERGRRRYVRQNLKIMGRLKSSDVVLSSGCGSTTDRERERERKVARRFVESYLRQDGVFVLKLVAKNSTDLVVADIIAALWDNYRLKPTGAMMVVGPPGGPDGGTRRQSPNIAYIADVANDLSIDPVDII